MKMLKPLTLIALVAVLIGALSVTPASAQEYKEVFNAAIESARVNDYAAAHENFARAATLARQADDAQVANQAARNAAIIDFNLGNQARETEDFDTALAHYNSGIQLFPSYTNNYVAKAVTYKRMEQREDAISAYRELIAFGEDNNNTEAVRQGEQAIRDEYIFLSSSALGRRAEPSQADATEAIGYLDELDAIFEPDANALFYRATANNALGNYQEAINLANQALEIHRGSRTDAAKIHFVKGEALMYSGDTAAAKESFQEATFGSYRSLAEHYLETL